MAEEIGYMKAAASRSVRRAQRRGRRVKAPGTDCRRDVGACQQRGEYKSAWSAGAWRPIQREPVAKNGAMVMVGDVVAIMVVVNDAHVQPTWCPFGVNI